MGIKAALIDGPVSNEVREKLEALGFEVISLHDTEQMTRLKSRLFDQYLIHKTRAIGMTHFENAVLDAVAAQQFSRHHPVSIGFHQAQINPRKPVDITMLIKAISQEPEPEVKIDKKKDRFTFQDHFVGRGPGRARNQNFAQHFRKKG